MSKSQSTSKPDIKQIHLDAVTLWRAHMRGDRSVCARIRKFSPQFSQASDTVILAASEIGAYGIVSHEHGYESWLAVHEANIGHKHLGGDASLEHLKKQAKKLVKAYQAGEGAAIERARAHGDGGEFTLNDALFVLAREYGFASWPKLAASLETPQGQIRMSRPQLFTIEHLHDKCARPLGEIFTRHLGEKAVCDTMFLDQTTYAKFIESISRPACLCTFAVEAMQSRVVLDIEMPLTFALLGKGDDEEQRLTEEEEGRMMPVFQDILAELQRAWESVLPTIFGGVEIETDPQLVKVTEARALVVLVGLEITSLNHSGFATIAYPLPDGIFELRRHFDRKS